MRKFYFCIFWFLLPSHSDDLELLRPKMFTFNWIPTSPHSELVSEINMIRPEMQSYLFSTFIKPMWKVLHTFFFDTFPNYPFYKFQTFTWTRLRDKVFSHLSTKNLKCIEIKVSTTGSTASHLYFSNGLSAIYLSWVQKNISIWDQISTKSVNSSKI